MLAIARMVEEVSGPLNPQLIRPWWRCALGAQRTSGRIHRTLFCTVTNSNNSEDPFGLFWMIWYGKQLKLYQTQELQQC